MSWNRPCSTPAHGIGGELEAAGFRVALDERIQARLVDRDLAPVQALDLARVDIDAHHMIARIRQAGTGDEADVAGAENGYTHSVKFLSGKEERRKTKGKAGARRSSAPRCNRGSRAPASGRQRILSVAWAWRLPCSAPLGGEIRDLGVRGVRQDRPCASRRSRGSPSPAVVLGHRLGQQRERAVAIEARQRDQQLVQDLLHPRPRQRCSMARRIIG